MKKNEVVDFEILFSCPFCGKEYTNIFDDINCECGAKITIGYGWTITAEFEEATI